MECWTYDISEYEGLVLSTARMYCDQVGIEFDDLAQEIRLKVVKVLRTYDPTRSKLSQRAYVFQCLMNMMKDLKRDAAQRKRVGLTEIHIEDFRRNHGNGAEPTRLDWFEFRYQHLDAEEVYGPVEEGDFVMPALVTEDEARISYLLMDGYNRTEVARILGLKYWVVGQHVRSLREKLKPIAA